MADSSVSRFGCYTIIWDTTELRDPPAFRLVIRTDVGPEAFGSAHVVPCSATSGLTASAIWTLRATELVGETARHSLSPVDDTAVISCTAGGEPE